MVSKEHKRAAFNEKLQVLRSLTNSHALRKSAIILEASKYIKELKQKVDRLNQEIASAHTAADKIPFPEVNVKTLEQGFLINVYSEKSCPGLLASVLEAFEDLGLNVLEAKASCTDAFHLVAIGTDGESMDAQVVKEAVQHAIKGFFEGNDQE